MTGGIRRGAALAAAVLLLAGCRGPGYREPGDSRGMTSAIEARNLASRVRVALGQDPATAPYESIRVTSDGSTVTLTGEVDRPDVEQRALRVARSVEGVERVVDEISVRTSSG